MVVYRIAACSYIDDLSGKGAALYGGRWNSKDVYMLYTAESPALAMLEAVVHIGRIQEKGYCMVSIELPDDKLLSLSISDLPADWHSHPAPDQLKKTGDRFIRENKALVIKVPSVLVPEEHNFLINPEHKDFKKVKILSNRQLSIDKRLLFATGNLDA